MNDYCLSDLGLSFKPFFTKVGKVVRTFTTTAGKVITAPVKMTIKLAKGAVKTAVKTFGLFKVKSIVNRVLKNRVVRSGISNRLSSEQKKKKRRLTTAESQIIVKHEIESNPVIQGEIKKEISGEGISGLGEMYGFGVFPVVIIPIIVALITIIGPILVAMINKQTAMAAINAEGDLKLGISDLPPGVNPLDPSVGDDDFFSKFTANFKEIGGLAPVLLLGVGAFGLILLAGKGKKSVQY